MNFKLMTFIISLSLNLIILAINSEIIQSDNCNCCPFQKLITCNESFKYSNLDGSCNNILNAYSGKSETTYKRFYPGVPAYQDGFNAPRFQTYDGRDLPNPRIASLLGFSSFDNDSRLINKENNLTTTLIFSSFGQFIAHDLSSLWIENDECSDCESTSKNCISIRLDYYDPYFSENRDCLPFSRSKSTSFNLNCTKMKYREQLNQDNSFLDATNVYGNSNSRNKHLRLFESGQLKTSRGNKKNQPFLKINDHRICKSAMSIYAENCPCWLSGDTRTNSNLGLAGIITLFNREHNRIAKKLAKLNPMWEDEIVYQETRRIIIAIYQHIVFNEWLPVTLGHKNYHLGALNTTSYYKHYNSSILSSIYNEFAAAAFRFGHSLVTDTINRYNSFMRQSFDNIRLIDTLNQTCAAYDKREGGLNSIFLGYLTDPTLEFGSFSFTLQNQLEEKVLDDNSIGGGDLLAFNLQRGRDHGLHEYIKYAELCGSKKIKSWKDLKGLLRADKIERLQIIYENVNEIDLYIGGLSEINVDGGVVGPTFACIIRAQFSELKNGDRFYYENGPSATSFTLEQLAEIKKIKLSRIICNNYKVLKISQNPFRILDSKPTNLVSCDFFPQLDLRKWKV